MEPTLPRPAPPATAARLRRLAGEGLLSADALERGLGLAGHAPDRAAWRWLLDRLLLLAGTLLLLAGIVFFFAYNWDDLGRFGKFGLLASGIVGATGAALWLGVDSWPGRVALLAAAILPGPLLAVYGQVYQTGADAYGLFLTWALLITGYVVLGRFSVLWVLWLMLLDTALILYWGQVVDPGGDQLTRLFIMLFALNAGALVGWEAGAERGIAWMRERWVAVLAACAALLAISIPAGMLLLTPVDELGTVPLRWVSAAVYAGALSAAVWYYRSRAAGLVILAAGAFSVIVLTTILVGRLLGDWAGTGLVIALLVIAELYGAVVWLRTYVRRREVMP